MQRVWSVKIDDHYQETLTWEDLLGKTDQYKSFVMYYGDDTHDAAFTGMKDEDCEVGEFGVSFGTGTSSFVLIKSLARVSVWATSRFIVFASSLKAWAKTLLSFSFIMPTVWNSLPATLRGMPTLPGFKAELKTYFFRQAFP